MALLNRLLRLLELLEYLVDLADVLTTPAGVAIAACLVSYHMLLLAHCDSATSAILASVAALALHCAVNRPKF